MGVECYQEGQGDNLQCCSVDCDRQQSCTWSLIYFKECFSLEIFCVVATGKAPMSRTCSSWRPCCAWAKKWLLINEYWNWFSSKYTWEFAISLWDDSKQTTVSRLLGLKRGRGKENFFPNLDISFSSIVWHQLLVTYTTQEVKLIPLKVWRWSGTFHGINVLSGNEALTLQVVAVDCVGTFCRKLSDSFCRINDDYL